MVFASICEHASSAFIFASASSDQFSHASSEHFQRFQMASSEQFVNLRQLESLFIKTLFCPSNLADTFKTGQQVQSQALKMVRPYRGSTLPSSLQPIMPCLICRLLQNYFTQLYESQWVDPKRDLKLSQAQFTSKQVPSQEG